VIPERGRHWTGTPDQSPWWAGWRLSVSLLVFVIAAGTTGYVVIEGWSPWDAFYMTIITVTTAGYKEVHPMSRAGEAFTSALLIGGVATALYTFTTFMARVVEGDLRGRWLSRRRERMIDDLAQHFIICGFGRIGRIIAAEFARQNIPFVIVERAGERVSAALELGYLAVEADASNEPVLNRVCISRARGLIAAVGTDAENVYAVLTARLLRPDLFIISRAETDDAKAKLARAGADRVISPYQIGGLQLAQTALRPAVVDFVQLATSSDNIELNMEQVKIAPGSELAGQSLIKAALRNRFSVVVVGIQRADGKMEFNPEPETVMKAGDQLVVLGKTSDLRELAVTAGDETQLAR
jgi:voltage-gated potassium channel